MGGEVSEDGAGLAADEGGVAEDARAGFGFTGDSEVILTLSDSDIFSAGIGQWDSD